MFLKFWSKICKILMHSTHCVVICAEALVKVHCKWMILVEGKKTSVSIQMIPAISITWIFLEHFIWLIKSQVSSLSSQKPSTEPCLEPIHIFVTYSFKIHFNTRPFCMYWISQVVSSMRFWNKNFACICFPPCKWCYSKKLIILNWLTCTSHVMNITVQKSYHHLYFDWFSPKQKPFLLQQIDVCISDWSPCYH